MGKIYNLNVTCSETLPSPYEMLQAMPLTPEQHDFIEDSRRTAAAILEGRDPRLMLILGPCSVHNIAAAKEYASKLRILSQEVEEHLFLVMRVYVEKPRTTVGWKGLLYDPHLDGSCDLVTGIRWVRQLFIEMANLKVPVATEFLDPFSPQYYGDLVSWGCIGARTASSQIHRQVASSLAFPVAFKNNTDGNVDIAIQGVLSAMQPHSYIGIDAMGRVAQTHTRGNPYCHIVLRGGDKTTNYDPLSIQQALDKLKACDLVPRVIVDCSHGNSQRIAQQQLFVFQSLMNQVVEGNGSIRGMQIESNLKGGAQQFKSGPVNLDYDISLTDPCLDWHTTESMVRWAVRKIKQEIPSHETSFKVVRP